MTTPQHTKPARLYRSREDRVIAGVAGGFARYLGVDPVLVRLAIVALAIIGGSGLLAYVIAWIVMPEEPGPTDGEFDAPAPDRPPISSGRMRMMTGVFLVLIGVGLFAQSVIPSLDKVFWPAVIVASGAGLIFLGAKR